MTFGGTCAYYYSYIRGGLFNHTGSVRPPGTFSISAAGEI